MRLVDLPGMGGLFALNNEAALSLVRDADLVLLVKSAADNCSVLGPENEILTSIEQKVLNGRNKILVLVTKVTSQSVCSGR